MPRRKLYLPSHAVESLASALVEQFTTVTLSEEEHVLVTWEYDLLPSLATRAPVWSFVRLPLRLHPDAFPRKCPISVNWDTTGDEELPRPPSDADNLKDPTPYPIRCPIVAWDVRFPIVTHS